MKTFRILIGAALGLILAGCAGDKYAGLWSNIVEKRGTPFEEKEVDSWNFVDFEHGNFSTGHCVVLVAFDHRRPAKVKWSNSENYYWDKSGKRTAGEKLCHDHTRKGSRQFSFIQTRKHRFSISGSWTADKLGAAEEIAESQIVTAAALLGRAKGFWFGVFDDTEQTADRGAGRTRTTREGSGSSVSQYGMTFGNTQSTTTVETAPGSVTVRRKHVVTFYEDDPGFDGAFDIALMLRSLKAEDYRVYGL